MYMYTYATIYYTIRYVATRCYKQLCTLLHHKLTCIFFSFTMTITITLAIPVTITFTYYRILLLYIMYLLYMALFRYDHAIILSYYDTMISLYHCTMIHIYITLQ